MAITEIIAVIIGIALAGERIVLLASPKTHRKAWKEIAKSPDSSIRMMGLGFLAAGVLLILASLRNVGISDAVVLAAAGWCLFLGCYAFAAKPLKSALRAFPKVDRRIMQLGNLVAVFIGIAIVYLVLK